MNRIKWLGLGCAIVCLAACSGGKYADAKAAVKNHTDATEEFISSIEKADSGAEVASALDQYSKQMAKMLKQSKKLREKYEDLDLQNAPELKEENERAKQVGMQFAGAFMKVGTQYGDDPEVQAAMTRFQETMTQMASP